MKRNLREYVFAYPETGSNLDVRSPRNDLLRHRMLSAQKTPQDIFMDHLKRQFFEQFVEAPMQTKENLS